MDTVQDITSRLKFIGRVKIGEKINTRGTFVQPDHIGTSFSRTFWNQDSRGNAHAYISDTVNKALGLINQYSSSKRETEKLLMKNILLDLKQVKIGINNLKTTYYKDTKFCCDLDTLQQLIDAHLLPYSTLLEKYGTEYGSMYSSQIPIPSSNTSNWDGQQSVIYTNDQKKLQYVESTTPSTSPSTSHINIAVSTHPNNMIEVQRPTQSSLQHMVSHPIATPHQNIVQDHVISGSPQENTEDIKII